MNIIINSGPTNGNIGKVVLNTTYQAAILVAETLNYSTYTFGVSQDQIIVNNASGNGYGVTLNESSVNTRYLVFDTNESAVLTWISNNHPTAEITNFAKSSLTLQ